MSTNKIQRNRHFAGRINNMHFGLCQMADGLVRVLSFGFLHSTFPIDQARSVSFTQLAKLKRQGKL